MFKDLLKNPRMLVVPVLLFVAGAGISALAFSAILDSRLKEYDERQLLRRTLQQQPVGLRTGASLPMNEPLTQFEEAAARSVNAVVFVNTRIGRGQMTEDSYYGANRGTGSGVIISSAGHIITNWHVVENASAISIILNDNTEYKAELVAYDPNTDLAVLKVEAKDLPVIDFGDSDHARIGQWVLAVGNPFSLTSTVTAGIISAKARNIGILRGQISETTGNDLSIEAFIQTDAAVNPGNSGGALVTLDGKLIGINTAIATETGVYSGYSFAIPSNLVRKVVNDLVEYGAVQRGFIGVSISDLDSKLNRDGKVTQGALVAGLTPNGAAKEAGVEMGDIIIAVDEFPVRSASELQERIAHHKPGDEVGVKIFRNGGFQELKLTLRNLEGGTALSPRKASDWQPI